MKVQIQIIDQTHCILGWDGRTYAYRTRFQNAGVAREEDVPGSNLRLLTEPMQDMSKEPNMTAILDIFGDAVLRDLTCCITVTGAEEPDSGPVAALLASLRAKPQLYFNAF